MTNGEMIQRVYRCEVCEPIMENDIINVIFDSAISIAWSWWNSEYKEPTTKIFADDCISRDVVKKYIQAHIHEIITESGEDKNKHTNRILRSMIHGVNCMPSVTPQEPRKGHWIMTSDYLTTAYRSIDYVKCSCCGGDSLEEGNYCPNCGADMREVENGNVDW